MEQSLTSFVKSFPSLQYWFEALTCRESTKRGYLLHFRNFCAWLKKTPDQLVEERRAELKSEDPYTQHTAEMNIKRYVGHLKELGKRPDTVRLAYYSIRSFYENHFLPLKLKRSDAPKKGFPRRRATKKEVQQLLSFANLRERALLLFLRDSGLAVSDAAALSYGAIREELESGAEFCTIDIERKKSGIPQLTFIGPEAIESLKTYLEERRRGTQHLYPPSAKRKGMPPEEINDRSPLFAQRDRTFSKLNGRDLSRIVKRLAEKAGAPTCTAHSIRKLFQTSLEEAGVPANWVMVMMAHKLGGSEGYYSLPSKQQLREAYQRAYAYLAVTREDTEKIVQERLKEIEAEYREKYEGLRKKLEEEPEWMGEFRESMKELRELAKDQNWKGHFKSLGQRAH